MPQCPYLVIYGAVGVLNDNISFNCRIDGDASGTVLVQTVVSEKETCVMGGEPGSTVLLPASQLSEYEKEQEKLLA